MYSLSTRKDPPMRAFPTAIATVSLCALTGCMTSPQRLDGQASPAGIRSPAVSVRPSAAAAPPSAPAAPPASPSRAATSDPASGETGTTSIIRRTDWANVSLRGVSFMDQGDLRFRDGTAKNCSMLPGGAEPAYGEYLTEEPADSPVTEDALVLVECGAGDDRVQALVMVQIGYDRKTRNAGSFIQADDAMTFLSYRIDGNDIITTLRKADGGTESRRYRFAGGTTWERV
jgi:hypothetical protein